MVKGVILIVCGHVLCSFSTCDGMWEASAAQPQAAHRLMRHPLRGGKLQQHSALLSQGRLGSAPGNNYPTDFRQMTFGFGGSLRRLSFSGKPESFRRDNLQASASPQHGRRLAELQNNA